MLVVKKVLVFFNVDMVMFCVLVVICVCIMFRYLVVFMCGWNFMFSVFMWCCMWVMLCCMCGSLISVVGVLRVLSVCVLVVMVCIFMW